MIQYKSGDVLASGCNYICHQVNCRGKMASGIAGQIRGKWPVVYNKYHEMYSQALAWSQNIDPINGEATPADYLLGDIQVVYIQNNDKGEFQYIINMFSQDAYGYDGETRYTSYDAFADCLYRIRNFVPKGQTIAFPWGIGCGLGNAHWNIIEKMIETILEDHEVYIYAQWMKHVNKENKENE